MAKLDLSMSNLDEMFPTNFTQEQIAKGKTVFLKELAFLAHKFYGGKQMTVDRKSVV